MIPLALCVGFVALMFWASQRYERHIRVWAKRYEGKVRLDSKGVRAAIRACEIVMEIYEDPQTDEYRMAMELKLHLERAERE